MSFRLILAEKPSVARDIARVLGVRGRGDGYIGDEELRVSWCVGHLVELAEPGSYREEWGRWRAEDLPMIPDTFSLAPRGEGGDQWKVVQRLLRDKGLTELVNACDAGREGELIFAYCYQLAGCRAPVKRLWISSLTDAAIHDGFRRLRPGSDMQPLEDAARCRSESDWVVGLNATRAFTLRLRAAGGDGLLSLGRVQTPVLALIATRDAEIAAFIPQDFWQVRATLLFASGELALTWTREEGEGKSVDRFNDRAEAEAVLERVREQPGLITGVDRREKAEPPPLLYDLTSLQREANVRFGLSARDTLDVAQALYERHKVITYPRTDSRHLGSDQAPLLPDLVRKLAFGPYATVASALGAAWPPLTERLIDDKEVSDHHAILPTGVDPRPLGLSPIEKRVYDLIVRRLLAALSPPARFALATVRAQIAGEPFLARGRQRLSAGWQAIDPPFSAAKETLLPVVERGEVGAPSTVELHTGQTRPPRPYTEATLLTAMERAGEGLDEAELRRAMKRNGLGTPATRAAILETLLQRKYLRRDARDLRVTEQGAALVAALPVEQLRSPRLTGQWEARLNDIADARDSRERFMADIATFTTEAVRRLLGAPMSEALRQALSPAESGEKLGACPRCGGEVRQGRGGWRCAGCPLRIPVEVAKREVSPRMAKALLRDGRTAVVKGFRSREGKEFSAALVLDPEGKVIFSFPEAEPIGACPACHTPVRPHPKGFFCQTGRECPFAVYREMSGRTIDEAAVIALLRDGRSGLITGFKDKSGASFDGLLVWEAERVRVRPVDARELEASIGPCRRCGAALNFQKGRWRCTGCDWSLPGEVASRTLRREELEALLGAGQTCRLYGFRQSSGKFFKAALALDEELHVKIDFQGGEDAPLPPGAPAPAFGERTDCPLCLLAGKPEPGYILRGHAAWGCSAWREGCKMKLPFIIDGRRLDEEDAKRLFSRHHATRYLDAFPGPRAAGRPCRVVIDPDAAQGWTLEPKARR